MTGKNIFAAIALMLFLAALVVFFHRSDTKIVVQELKDRPKVKLYQFEYYRIRDDVETARMIGKQAELMDGGIVYLREGFRGVRTRDERREEVTASSADILLSQASIGQMSGNVHAKTARLYDEVELTMADGRFESQEVSYTDEGSSLYTDKPVQIFQQNQIIRGRGGFEYSIDKETLRMRGGVSGSLIPKEITSARKKGKTP